MGRNFALHSISDFTLSQLRFYNEILNSISGFRDFGELFLSLYSLHLVRNVRSKYYPPLTALVNAKLTDIRKGASIKIGQPLGKKRFD
jgi:hypothetical protein